MIKLRSTRREKSKLGAGSDDMPEVCVLSSEQPGAARVALGAALRRLGLHPNPRLLAAWEQEVGKQYDALVFLLGNGEDELAVAERAVQSLALHGEPAKLLFLVNLEPLNEPLRQLLARIGQGIGINGAGASVDDEWEPLASQIADRLGQRGAKPKTEPPPASPSATTISAIDRSDLREKLRALSKLAKEQGYLTFDDLNQALPDNVNDPDDIEAIMGRLRSMEIEIIEASDVDRFKDGLPPRRDYSGEEREGALTWDEMTPQQQEEEYTDRLDAFRKGEPEMREKLREFYAQFEKGGLKRKELEEQLHWLEARQKEIADCFGSHTELPAEEKGLSDELISQELDISTVLAELSSKSGAPPSKTAAVPTESVAPSVQPAAAPPALRRSFATFQSDVPPPEIMGLEAAVPDALKLGDYARHLAELMGARETPLPLSLGLFGDWGTGKTHFMRLLRQEMRRQRPAEGAPPGGAESPWCRQVVTVQFNAWHYLDANLWASLVTEIFERLFKHLNPDPEKAQKAKLLKQLEKANGAAAKAKDEVRQAEVAESAAKGKLAKTQKSLDEKSRTLAGELDKAGELLKIVGQTGGGMELIKSWRELRARLGWEELEKSASELEGQLAQTHKLAVRAQVLWKTAFGPKNWLWTLAALGLLLVVVPLLGAAVGLVFNSHFPDLKTVGRWVGAVSGGLTTVAGALAFWMQRAQKYLGEAEQFQRRLSAARKKREEDPELAPMRKAIEKVEVLKEAAVKGLAHAQARVRALKDELREQEPERRLLRFIGERARAEDYRKHLGLVSLVRRDFETLSNLFAETQAAGGVKPKKEGTLEASVDRIILYVDDLDRCPAKRVVEVLEAVHLLLAFPLFVVVVAVDPRWLQRSLRQHYPELLEETAKPKRKGGAAEALSERRPASSMDYLEKIFHVPFHLPRMETDGYKDLVTELTQSMPAAEQKAAVFQPSVEDAEKGLEEIRAHKDGAEAQDFEKVASLREEEAKVKETLQRELEKKRDAPPPQSVRLSAEEIAALKDYAAFIRTPRAVKRLLNTYRLVRAGLDNVPREKLPAGANLDESYRPAMLLLAVAAGFPRLARAWFEAIRMEGNWEAKLPPELQAMPEAKQLCDALASCKAEIPAQSWPQDWSWWIDRVGRFAF